MFQTACANYFLCNGYYRNIKGLEWRVSNRLRELFPLQRKGRSPERLTMAQFQTACANYFLCNVMTRLPVNSMKRGFKPLARIISSATFPSTVPMVPKHSFQTACANYFLCNASKCKIFPRVKRFQTACANYFLCNDKYRAEYSKRKASFKPLARIISSATVEKGIEWNARVGFKPLARIISSATPRSAVALFVRTVVSNRLRELFPLQRIVLGERKN